jgi:hypothetical protein
MGWKWIEQILNRTQHRKYDSSQTCYDYPRSLIALVKNWWLSDSEINNVKKL